MTMGAVCCVLGWGRRLEGGVCCRGVIHHCVLCADGPCSLLCPVCYTARCALPSPSQERVHAQGGARRGAGGGPARDHRRPAARQAGAAGGVERQRPAGARQRQPAGAHAAQLMTCLSRRHRNNRCLSWGMCSLANSLTLCARLFVSSGVACLVVASDFLCRHERLPPCRCWCASVFRVANVTGRGMHSMSLSCCV